MSDVSPPKLELTHLRGKRVLLSGGTTGIGRALLLTLVGEGCELLTFGRNAAPLAEALRVAGLAEDRGLVADAGSKADMDRVFAEVDARLGGLDILICNAAVGARSIAEMEDARWRYAVETNLVGYMAAVRGAIDRMVPQGEGHIVLVSSISGDIPADGESVYAATKAGVDGFGLSLRQELRESGIAVSMISPGSVTTEMQECTPEEQARGIELEEMLLPEDVADAVLYILTRPHRCDIFDIRIEPRRQAIPSKS